MKKKDVRVHQIKTFGLSSAMPIPVSHQELSDLHKNSRAHQKSTVHSA